MFADSEEVKHEEYQFVPRPPRAITQINTTNFSSSQQQPEALFYTGLIYSRLPRPADPSLETDKLDLSDIIAQIEEKIG